MLLEFKNYKNTTETAEKICNIYDQDAITECQVWNCFWKFNSDDISLRDEPRPGCSSDLDQNALRKLGECRGTQELAHDFNTSQSTICYHLKKIGKVSKLGVWVPHTLSQENKKDHLSVVTSLLSRQENDMFIKNITTGDEKCLLWHCSMQCSKSGFNKDESPLSIPVAECYGRKVMLCVLWYYHGIIHIEFLNCNQTLNADL